MATADRSTSVSSTSTRPRAWATAELAARNAGTDPVPRSADTSPHTTSRTVGDGGERPPRRRWEAAGRVDAERPGGAGGERLAQPPLGAGGADRTTVTARRPALGQPQSDLQRGPIGVGDAGPALVGLTRDPLPGDGDHERWKTTPWPPSG